MADKLTLDRHAMKDRATAHLRIYVGGLTDKANVEELYNHFIPYGQINGIIINRIFGFVQFDKESSAQEAIYKADGSIFQGKSINVRTAQTNADKSSKDLSDADIVLEQYDALKEGLEITRKNSLRRDAEGMHSDVPPAVALNDNLPVNNDDGTDEHYDSYGNYIGDQKNYREEEYDEGYNQNWGEGREGRGGARGRGLVRGRGRGGRGRGAPGAFRDRSPIGNRTGNEWSERGGYDRYSQPEYPRALPVSERNDCEIIVVSKAITEYAEYIEGRLKRLGIVVDLLFPMEDVPIGKVLGNIASRGCLYAILVMPQNQEHRSLTLTILHGLPQEHRNMPLEDALQLISRNFQEVQRGGPQGREAVYALLGQLADGRTLTVLQYDKVIEYLQERKEQQVKIELGEPLTTTPANNKTQVDLQQRILNILNEKKVLSQSEPTPAPMQAVPPPTTQPQSKLLSDPTVRKALDSILQKYT